MELCKTLHGISSVVKTFKQTCALSTVRRVEKGREREGESTQELHEGGGKKRSHTMRKRFCPGQGSFFGYQKCSFPTSRRTGRRCISKGGAKRLQKTFTTKDLSTCKFYKFDKGCPSTDLSRTLRRSSATKGVRCDKKKEKDSSKRPLSGRAQPPA